MKVYCYYSASGLRTGDGCEIHYGIVVVVAVAKMNGAEHRKTTTTTVDGEAVAVADVAAAVAGDDDGDVRMRKDCGKHFVHSVFSLPHHPFLVPVGACA